MPIHDIEEHKNRTGLEIAVIGMAGRFPMAKNIDQLWENLEKGRECITFFNREELSEAGVDSRTLSNPDYVPAGINLEDKEYFDADFFGYTPTDALAMDPQMRILHECAWEALENAGYNPETYEGIIGFYVGASPSFYWEIITRLSGQTNTLGEFHTSLLSNRDYISTHISYQLNLKGPSFTLQTACSTSLVAIDLACRGLLTGQCTMAIAGGIKVSPGQNLGYIYREGMILSPDGHCYAFDQRAQGTIGGEGAGLVVLKTLEDAEADRDHIEAVIIGTAVNNDGKRKVGYTAPSIEGQTEVITAAHHMAGIEPGSIVYVETHGTGTPLGDPIEISALTEAFATEKKGFCAIGAIKTNLGHLDSAAGVAGFIKTVLVLKHKTIPPYKHFQQPNPKIDFSHSPFYINTGLIHLKQNNEPLRAGVSSFGIGGTNAHILLEEAPTENKELKTTTNEPDKKNLPHLLIWSGKTKNSLGKIRNNLVEYLEKNQDLDLNDVAYTLQVGRKSMEYREMLLAGNKEEAVTILKGKETGKRKRQSVHGIAGERRVIFMFAGLGAQYINMGLGLTNCQPVFKKELDDCLAILDGFYSYSLKDILFPVTRDKIAAMEELNRPGHIQPLLFSFEYALARMLISWGIEPDGMIGYSFGEYVAACLAGVFSLADALELVVKRGELIEQVTGGAMLSVPLLREELLLKLRGHEELSLAIDNGPSCIVAGPKRALERFEKELKTQKYMSMWVPGANAIHSRMMNGIGEEYEKLVARVQLNEPVIPYISNVTGTWTRGEEAIDPGYWRRHLVSTVEFKAGINELLNEAGAIFIEIGPGYDLGAMVKRSIEPGGEQKVLNLVRPGTREIDDWEYLLGKLGWMWLYGVRVDWQAFYGEEKRFRLALPTYPFTRKRFHLEAQVPLLSGFPAMTNRKTGEKEEVDDGGSSEEKELEGEYARPALSSEYVAPRTGVEIKLVGIWEELLGFKGIGSQDDFFELGGHSLRASVLALKIQQEFNVKMTLADIFKAPTIEGMAARMEEVEKETYTWMEAAEEREYYPVAPMQKQLYILDAIKGVGVAYNTPDAKTMKGLVDKNRLQKAFNELIKRHETLRTSFVMVKGEPVQRVHARVDFQLDYRDIADAVKSHRGLVQEITRDFIQPFDFSCAPLLRASLIKVAGDEYILLFDMHHMVSDGASMGILVRDVQAFYDNRGDDLPVLPIQYKDYVMWQRQGKGKALLEKYEAFWLEQFKPGFPVADIFTDYPRGGVQDFSGSSVVSRFDPDLSRAIHGLMRETGTTLYMVLLAAFSILISRYTGKEDVIIGSAVAGREHIEVQNLVGLFINTLPMRNFPGGEKEFKGFLEEVKQRTLAAYENQEYSFAGLLEKLNIERDISRNPLYVTELTVQNTEVTELAVAAVSFSSVPLETNKTQMDISFNVSEAGENIRGVLYYSTRLFKRETVEGMMSQLQYILELVTGQPGIRLGEIKIGRDMGVVSIGSAVHGDDEDDFGF